MGCKRTSIEFTVKKRWTSKGEAVEVSTKDEDDKKTVKTSPQAFLNKVIGDLSFDPLAFQGMRPEAQVDLLKKIVGLDFADLDKDSEGVYNERTALNSRIKESLAHLKNTQAPDPDTPDEEILFKDALGRLNEIRIKQEVYLNTVKVRGDAEERIDLQKTDITDIETQIASLQSELKDGRVNLEDLESQLKEIALPPVVSQDDIRTAEIELEEIELKNADIRAAKRYREAVRQADKLKKASDGLTQRLDRIAQDKQTSTSLVKQPVDLQSLIFCQN